MRSVVAGSGEVERKRRILERSELFRQLEGPQLEALAGNGAIVKLGRRRVLDGEPPSVFVLGSGRVRLVRKSSERDVTVAYCGAGSLVGESRLISAPDPTVAVAIDQVEALRMPLSVVRQVLESDVGLALRLTKLISERRMAAESRLEAVLCRPVESRVVEFLLEVAKRHGIPEPRGTLVGVKFTHQEIASYVGSTRETVTLVLGQLKRAGTITFDHRRVVIVDEESLRSRV